MLHTDSLRREAHDMSDVFKSYLVSGAQFCGLMEFPILPQNKSIPDSLTEFRRLKKPNLANQFIHFYIPDRNFQCVYNSPCRYVDWFKRFGGIIGFDYSSFAECPVYKQVEMLGKGRELSFWFAKQGVNVIPNVRWGLKETYGWCFSRLPKNSTVAVSTLGCNREMRSRKMFLAGFSEMLQRLEPTAVVVYGTKNARLFPPLFVGNTKLIYFDSHFTSVHRKEAV